MEWAKGENEKAVKFVGDPEVTLLRQNCVGCPGLICSFGVCFRWQGHEMNARILSILDSKDKIANVTRIGKTGEVAARPPACSPSF